MATVMQVARTPDGGVTPELDNSWSQLRRLQWHAAVASLDTGIQLSVCDAEEKVNGVRIPGAFAVVFPGGAVAPLDFAEARACITGIGIGVALARVGAVS